MDAPTDTPSSPEKGKNPRTAYLLIVILLILVSCGLLYLNYYRNEEKKKVEEENKELKNDNIAMQEERTHLLSRIDELNQEVNTLNQQVKYKDEELMNVGLKLKKKAGDLSLSQEDMKKLKAQVEQYELWIKDYQKQIDDLKAQNLTLASSNEVLNNEVMAQNQKIYNLETVNENQSQKLKVASMLKAESIRFSAIRKNDKKKTGVDFKSKETDKIEICVDLSENPVTEPGDLNVYVVFYNPDGSISKDMSLGSGTFTLANGEEKVYTVKQTINYDRTAQTVCLVRTRGELPSFPSGKHTVEVYVEDYLVGTGSFTLR